MQREQYPALHAGAPPIDCDRNDDDQTTPTSRPPREAIDVLIVEDEPMVALNLKEVLEQYGYHVIGIAADAERASILAETFRPHLSIVDFRLASAIDGVTLAHELVQRYHSAVVFVTGDPRAVCEHGWEFRHAILAKPFSDGELEAAIAAACRPL